MDETPNPWLAWVFDALTLIAALPEGGSSPEVSAHQVPDADLDAVAATYGGAPEPQITQHADGCSVSRVLRVRGVLLFGERRPVRLVEDGGHTEAREIGVKAVW